MPEVNGVETELEYDGDAAVVAGGGWRVCWPLTAVDVPPLECALINS